MAKYVDKPWDGAKSRWKTVEDLLQCIPNAMAQYARSTVKGGDQKINKSDCHLPYKEPQTHDINVNGISAALVRIPSVKGPSASQKASARVELSRANVRARKALGLPAAKEKAVFREYYLSAKNYSIDQLIMAAPIEYLEYLVMKAEQEKRDIIPSDFQMLVAEADGTLNLNLVNRSINELGSITMPFAVKGAIRVELLSLQKRLESQINDSKPSTSIMSESLLKLFTDQINLTNEFKELPVELAAPKQEEYTTSGIEMPNSKGVPSTDFRTYPNFKALGITRPAGVATPEEAAYFKGQLKPDNSPVDVNDFFSTGVLLACNDLMEDRYLQIPKLELARMAEMINNRFKGSDLNHEFKSEDGQFVLVDAKLGSDPSVIMHEDSVINEPYTALISRAVFPVLQQDPKQISAVERVKRGLSRNVSIAAAVGYYTCGNCGELPIDEIQKIDSKITALKIQTQDPEMADRISYCGIVIRTPSPNTPGGYIYTDAVALASEDGIISVKPFDDPGISSASRLMVKMEIIPMLYSEGKNGPKYCMIHGLQGSKSYMNDEKVVAVACNLKNYVATSGVTSGGFNDAVFVLDPDNYKPH